MRTLLRNARTGCFFGGPDRWTKDPEGAVDFKMIDRALQFIEQWGLDDVEIAFAFRQEGIKVVPMERVRVLFHQS